MPPSIYALLYVPVKGRIMFGVDYCEQWAVAREPYRGSAKERANIRMERMRVKRETEEWTRKKNETTLKTQRRKENMKNKKESRRENDMKVFGASPSGDACFVIKRIPTYSYPESTVEVGVGETGG